MLTRCSVDIRGKKVAVIGTGATGIQCSQEIGKTAESMTVFQRTPNLCLPMGQKKLTKEEQDKEKPNCKLEKIVLLDWCTDILVTDPEYYKHRMTTFAGFPYDFSAKNTFDDSAEEREAFYEKLWNNGAYFQCFLTIYNV